MKEKKCHPILWKIEWLIEWLFPCMSYSYYGTNGHNEVTIWRSWFGHVLWERTFIVE